MARSLRPGLCLFYKRERGEGIMTWQEMVFFCLMIHCVVFIINYYLDKLIAMQQEIHLQMMKMICRFEAMTFTFPNFA